MSSCTQMRRKLVTRKSLNIATGETTMVGQDWQTEPCGVPLFGAGERERGTCSSCHSGWTHPHNFPCDDSGKPLSATKGDAA